ncbi:natural killer cells antigen CD94-like [Carettochelys insculpta]|uniref:natural killer cells antigen CD94-like n=1 Tax=Carettochelys insculpta TaxID=44489 RepID=UPI003EBCDDC5
MNQEVVTYADLKFHISEQQKKPRHKNTRTKEINKLVTTHREQRCHNATEQQRRGRTTNPQSKDSAPAPAWRLVAGILGFLCLTLVITVVVVATNAFQIFPVPCRQQDNLTQFQKIIQGWKLLCPENWFSHGEKCYHFSTETKSWLESREACSSSGSRLLLIENKDELDFIRPLTASHWIGLSRATTDGPWMWGNGTAFSNHQLAIKKGFVDGNCALVRGGELTSEPCDNAKRYICEQLVLFPDPDISA